LLSDIFSDSGGGGGDDDDDDGYNSVSSVIQSQHTN
jgi:hypothetical protein